MIRLTLRQFRTEGLIGFGLLAVLAIVLAVTGAHLAHLNDAFEATCKATGSCNPTSNPTIFSEMPLQSLLPLIVVVAPALVGVFYGAPLIARELETGTFRLAWTQSVTRQRWLAVKLALVGLAAMVLSGLLTWMVDWWTNPLDAASNAASQNRFDLGNFAFHGVAPIGYAAFAFALGAAAGVLLHRTVPAMAVTLGGFIAARLAVTYWVRPHLMSPLKETLPLSAASRGLGFSLQAGKVSMIPPQVNVPNGWVYSTVEVNKAGRAPTSQYLVHTCPGLAQPPGTGSAASAPVGFQTCMSRLSETLHTVVTYQPGSRFWIFQWAEMGIFLAAGVVQCGATYWWLRRQYS